MIVRELLAAFGIALDQASVQRADAAFARVRDTVGTADRSVRGMNERLRDQRGRFIAAGASASGVVAPLGAAAAAATATKDSMGGLLKVMGGVFALGGAKHLTLGLLGLASDADEANNVINEIFEDGAGSVRAWAKRVGAEIGRSEYTMRTFAGSMGAMLLPMLQGNREAAAEMSQTIAQLGVDLSSFFNTTEDEALTALRAGLAGEAEPLKKYGIVMLEATLQEFAHAEGIRAKVKDMTIAEKTELRYRFILANTTKAQGDAAKTLDGYANSARAAADAVKDLGTRMGERIIPVARRMLHWFREGAHALKGLVETSHIAEVAMGVLAAAAVALGWSMLAPFLPAILAGAKVVAILTAIGLVIDDVITFFSGGTSVIGEFIDATLGLGTSAQFLENWNLGLEEMGRLLDESTAKWAILWSEFDRDEVHRVDRWNESLEEMNRLLGIAAGWWQKVFLMIESAARLMARIVDPFAAVVGGRATGGSASAPRRPIDTTSPITRPEGMAAPALSVPFGGRTSYYSPDVRANITINADPRDTAIIESSTRDGLGRALRDAREAFSDEVD